MSPQLVLSWNGGKSTSPAVDAAPNEAWRVAVQSDTYILVRDSDLIPAPGETLVTNDVLALVDLAVTVDGKPVVGMPLPSGKLAALVLKSAP